MEIRLVILAGLVAASTASAGDIPRYDVAVHCENMAGIGGNYSASVYNTCVEVEQDAYNGLKTRWEGLPNRVRSHCDELASIGGTGSYSVLETCVEVEMDAEGNKKAFQY